MSTDRVTGFRLVAAALVAVLLFSPGVGDGPVDREGPVSGGAFARSIAPTGDRAVVELGRKPSPIEFLLAHPRVASPVWALLLAPLLLAAAGRWSRVDHHPSRPLAIMLRRAAPHRAPPLLRVP